MSTIDRPAVSGAILIAIALLWFVLGFVALAPTMTYELLGAGADLVPLALLCAGVALMAPSVPGLIRPRLGTTRAASAADRAPVSAAQVSLVAFIALRVLVVLIGFRAIVGYGLVGVAAHSVAGPVVQVVQLLLLALVVVVLLWGASLVLMAVLKVKRTVNGTQAGLAERGAGFGATAARWVAAQLTRLVGVVVGRGGAAVALLLLGVVGFIAYGGAGFRAVVAPNEGAVSRIPPSRFGDWLLATAEKLLDAIRHGPSWAHLRLPNFGGFSFERGSSRVEGQQMRWVDEIVIARAYNPQTKQVEAKLEKAWDRKKLERLQSVADLELAQIATALAHVYDGHLTRMLMKMPSIGSFDLRISGWTNPVGGYHALIVKVGPPNATLLARQVRMDDVLYLVDATTNYTEEQLKRAVILGDRRVIADPMRGGETGLFIGISYRDRADEPDAHKPHSPDFERSGDAIRDAVSQALAETAGDPDRFVFRSRAEGYGEVRYTYALQLRERDGQFTNSASAAAEAVKQWVGLRDMAAHHAKLPPADLLFDYDHYAQRFILVQRIALPAFPGDDPHDPRTSLLGWITANADAMARFPRRFVVGKDARDNAVTVDLGHPMTPHVLITGGTGSAKSTAGLLSAVTQLVASNSPDQMRVLMIDPKGELTALLEDTPHAERVVIAKRPSETLELLEDVEREVYRRRDSKRGYIWSPDCGDPWWLVLVEEIMALHLAAEGDKDERDAERAMFGKIGEMAAIARSAGVHFAVVSQKGTTDVIPAAITANLPAHIVGRSRPADYQQMLETQDVAIDRSGKLAWKIAGTPDDPIIVGGLVDLLDASDRPTADPITDTQAGVRGIRRVIEEVVLPKWGGRTEPLRVDEFRDGVKPRSPFDASGSARSGASDPTDTSDEGSDEEGTNTDTNSDFGAEADDPLADHYVPGTNDPNAISSARFGPLEAARELYHWWTEADASGPLIFSAPELMARLRQRYGKSPKELVIRRTLRRLTELTVVEDVSVNGRPMRQLVPMTWADMRELIESRTENDEPSDDRLFERRTAA